MEPEFSVTPGMSIQQPDEPATAARILFPFSSEAEGQRVPPCGINKGSDTSDACAQEFFSMDARGMGGERGEYLLRLLEGHQGRQCRPPPSIRVGKQRSSESLISAGAELEFSRDFLNSEKTFQF